MTNSDVSAYFVQFLKSLFCNYTQFDVMVHILIYFNLTSVNLNCSRLVRSDCSM
jgi:hypothetical protein